MVNTGSLMPFVNVMATAWWNGRSSYWGQEGYGNHGNYNESDLRAAYQTLLDEGLTFIDTAEVIFKHIYTLSAPCFIDTEQKGKVVD